METIPAELAHAAGPKLGNGVNDWWMRDLSNSYSWLQPRKLFWIIDGESGDSAILAEMEGNEWKCLNQPDGLATIGELMRSGVGDYAARQMNAREFVLALVELYHDPRVYICDPQFIEEEEFVLDTFISSAEHDEKELRSICATQVELTGAGDATWRSNFLVLNREGGVDRWRAEGRNEPFAIDSVQVTPEKPSGTFFFPDEF